MNAKTHPDLESVTCQWLGLITVLAFFGLTAPSYKAAPNESAPLDVPGKSVKKRLLPPKGLIIYKRHIEADEHAPAVEYAAFRRQPAAVDMTRHGGGFVSIPSHQIVKHLVYPNVDVDLQSEERLDRRKAKLAEYRVLAKRFKKATPYLHRVVLQLEYEIHMWDQGNCRVDGSWKNRYDHQVAILRAEFEKKRLEILGRYPSTVNNQTDDLPPLWSVAMEIQIEAEEKEKLEAEKRAIEARRTRRTRNFHDSVEDDRPFRTGWRLR